MKAKVGYGGQMTVRSIGGLLLHQYNLIYNAAYSVR